MYSWWKKNGKLSLRIVCFLTIAVVLLRLNSEGGRSDSSDFPVFDLSSSNSRNSLFSFDYQSSRKKFIEAAIAAGVPVDSFSNPVGDAIGQPIFTDVVYFGHKNAKKVLMLSSGTHGVEGFAGAAIQTGLMLQGFFSNLDADTGVLLVHAINPYGMAFMRRFNENNVDLNRNFRNHHLQAPDNSFYRQLADVLSPSSLSAWNDFVYWSKMMWLRISKGDSALRHAVSGGQYTHANGLFYGGVEEAWSNKTIRHIVRKYLRHADEVVVIDIHTGLGGFSEAEMILNSPTVSREYQTAVEIWGSPWVRSTVDGDSVSTHLNATLKLALPKMLSGVAVTAVSLEFGTYPGRDVISALREENWLHFSSSDDDSSKADIKAQLLEVFYPDDDLWRARIWFQGRRFVSEALEYLERSSQK